MEVNLIACCYKYYTVYKSVADIRGRKPGASAQKVDQ
jgi:hypothetical protein